MTTLGWLLIFGGILLIRQVSRGRVTNLGEDISDLFVAASSGDTESISEVLNRTGDSTVLSEATIPVTPSVLGGVASVESQIGSKSDAPAKNKTILEAAITLGFAAKGYRFGASGPDYYDCSGLVWRACQQAGFTGIRFTTFTIVGNSKFRQISAPSLGVSQATYGDIVVWPTHHMGVVNGTDSFYSARNPTDGIGTSKISTFEKTKPIYLRYMG